MRRQKTHPSLLLSQTPFSGLAMFFAPIRIHAIMLLKWPPIAPLAPIRNLYFTIDNFLNPLPLNKPLLNVTKTRLGTFWLAFKSIPENSLPSDCFNLLHLLSSLLIVLCTFFLYFATQFLLGTMHHQKTAQTSVPSSTALSTSYQQLRRSAPIKAKI